MKEFVPEKVLFPEKVLLFARSVEEAAVMALLQPKVPLAYVIACEALLQEESPAPKKFVVDALVAKRFVEVAFVVVARVKVAPWNEESTVVEVAVKEEAWTFAPVSAVSVRALVK